MDRICLTGISKENGFFTTKKVASTAEKIVFKASGNASSNNVSYKIFTYDSNGTEGVAFDNTVSVTDGKFSIDYSFDPLYLSVYHSAHQFRIAIFGELTLENLVIEEASNTSDNEYISFSNIVTENGEKKATVKQVDGTEITVPIVPKKVLFMGNSLLLGMTYYGMCATDPENDYYYHVTNKIKEYNPDCQFVKLHGVHFECNDSVQSFYDNVYKNPNRVTGRPTIEDLTDDIDLAIIQIGDNANNPERVEVYKQTCEPFMKILKENCPKARIIWVYGWYNKAPTHAELVAGLNKWKIESIDLSTMMPIKENQATKGQTYVKPDGSIEVAPDGWLSHPGNAGMYRIAKKILEKIGL